jgi:hypothetical protein
MTNIFVLLEYSDADEGMVQGSGGAGFAGENPLTDPTLFEYVKMKIIRE